MVWIFEIRNDNRILSLSSRGFSTKKSAANYAKRLLRQMHNIAEIKLYYRVYKSEMSL